MLLPGRHRRASDTISWQLGHAVVSSALSKPSQPGVTYEVCNPGSGTSPNVVPPACDCLRPAWGIQTYQIKPIQKHSGCVPHVRYVTCVCTWCAANERASGPRTPPAATPHPLHNASNRLCGGPAQSGPPHTANRKGVCCRHLQLAGHTMAIHGLSSVPQR